MKLTPDQLHRLIDEVAKLVDQDDVIWIDIAEVCRRAECYEWWCDNGKRLYLSSGGGHAGLSAVLILLSEGG